MNPSLAEIRIYPVKSCAGLSLDQARITPRGLQHDRRWMVIDASGRFITQRTVPKMAVVRVQTAGAGLQLSAPEMSDLTITTPAIDAGERAVQVWDDQVNALDGGEEAATWISQVLGMSCRLVYMPERTRRLIDRRYATAEDQIVSFADGFPVLLITQASLDDLNGRLTQAVPMDRFRPNLVVTGTSPFAEDSWRKIRIGEAVFDVVKPCSRCAVPNVDQTTGVVQGSEPLRTLAAYRKREGKVYYGQNLIPGNEASIRVGDAVRVMG